ncbi:hypothetical protein EDD11_008261, partial [Mortierella claussenii]
GLQQRVNEDKTRVADLNEVELEQIIARKVQATEQGISSRSSPAPAGPTDVFSASSKPNPIASTNSGNSEGVIQEFFNVVHSTKADDTQSLKCRAMDNGKSKGGKARKTTKEVQKTEKVIESLQQRRTERYRLLDSSCFWKLKSSGRDVEKVLFEATLKLGASVRYFLYNKKPSPFIVEDLSESWWARTAWPAWLDLLNDTEGIFMVDGEKGGIDSSRRKNIGRQYNAEEPSRKKMGKKLDLICRDEIQKCDWMVVERMRAWDPNSTKLLKEVEHVVIRETVTIAQNRMSEVPSAFRGACRFFGGYTGGRGYTLIQLRPANCTSYVLLMQRSPMYVLPTEMNGLRTQFQDLVKILQTRAAMLKTIELYKELQMSKADDEDDEEDESLIETDISWMYEEPSSEFNSNLVLASSPPEPGMDPYSSDMEDDLDGST